MTDTHSERRILRTIGTAAEEHAGKKYWNCNVMAFDGKEYVFSHRAILTLVVVAACNAACKFCSNEVTFTPSGPYLRYDERLKRVKDFALLGGVTKIAYTGGEPTLHPQKLHDLVCEMSREFERSRLHTNGSGLFKTVVTDQGERMLLPALIDAGMTGASISVAHHDGAMNRELMRFSRGWTETGEEQLREIATYGSKDFMPRLSCVMTDDGVRDAKGILEYVTWGRSLGYRRFIFRSCSEIPEDYRKPTDFSKFNSANYIPIEPIVAELEKSGRFELTYRQRKSDSKVDVFRWGDVVFDVDESSEEPDPDPKIRRLNVMTNGVAHTSWIDPMSVLFEDDRHLAEKAMRREFQLV